MSAQKPIVVIGSINMDLVARTPRIPAPGETLTGSDFVTTPGGKGANQAVAVARLGYPVTMLGMVGEDVFGEALLENLRAAGVDTHAMAQVAGPSGVAPITVSDDGQNSIVVVPGANGKVDHAYLDRNIEIIRSAGMILCQLEIPMGTITHTLEICAEAKVPVMLDPAPAAPLPDSVWSKVAWFTPNETEAPFYAGAEAAAEQSSVALRAKGAAGLVLKRGAEGAFVVDGKRSGWVKPFQVGVVDTVAAGDCFNGAFAVALMEGKDPWTAARFASAAAAISVTRRGAQASMPTRAEADAFLRTIPTNY